MSQASDIAIRAYHETTKDEDRDPNETYDIMKDAQEKLIKSIRQRNFEKYISVADSRNGEDFFMEVCSFIYTLMTII